MLSTAPTVMEECVQSLSQPQQMRNILKYQKEANAEIKGFNFSDLKLTISFVVSRFHIRYIESRRNVCFQKAVTEGFFPHISCL